MLKLDADIAIRTAAFEWLRRENEATGGILDYQRLCSTNFDGEKLALIDPAGRNIRNPIRLVATLSVMTSPEGPYDEIDDRSGLVRYHFRVGRADQGDNIKLVRAHELGLPIIYFRKIGKKSYASFYPVRVTGVDNVGVVLDISESCAATDELGTTPLSVRRYVTAQSKNHLHHVVFRLQVLLAYATSCAVCRLHEPRLLEASCILNNTAGGKLEIINGLSLCSLHHRAYQQNVLGISANARIHIAPRLLADKNGGSILLHGFREMHGLALALPQNAKDGPDRDHLGLRFQQFQNAIDSTQSQASHS